MNKLQYWYLMMVGLWWLMGLTTLKADPAVIDSITGKGFRIVEAAVPKAIEAKVDLDKYTVSVMDLGEESYYVVFADPKRPPGLVGASLKNPSFQVEIRKIDLRVISSNFVR
jgi:hypothetical protein